MPAFRFNNCLVLYFHIPKAGGTSIEAWLSEKTSKSLYQKFRLKEFPCVPQHYHGDVINSLFAPDFFDYSFCVTRNPYSRIISEYHYRITRPRLKNKILPKPSFKRWLVSAFSKSQKDPYVHSNHIRPQHEFTIEGTEHFKLEDGHSAMCQRLSEVTGMDLGSDIPHMNVSRRRNTNLNKECADLIHSHYARDFEMFGYDPESWREIANPKEM